MKRNSNIELLRILLLVFLIFTHVSNFIMKGGGGNLPLSLVWIEKISVISVTTFAIITGYFSINSKRLRAKKYFY